MTAEQKQLSRLAEWFAYNGHHNLVMTTVERLEELRHEYVGDHGHFVELIGAIANIDYDSDITELIVSLDNLKHLCAVPKSEEKPWKDLRDRFIHQLVISKLWQSLGLSEDVTLDDLNFNNDSINVDACLESALSATKHNHFTSNKKNAVDVDLSAALADLVTKGKARRFAKRKLTLFFEAHSLDTFKSDACDFIQDLFVKASPPPFLEFEPRSEVLISSSKAPHSSSKAAPSAPQDSDDFFDTASPVRNKGGRPPKKGGAAKVAAPKPASPAPVAVPSSVRKAPAPTVAAPPSSSTKVPEAAAYSRATHDFARKYEANDPLRDIYNAAVSLGPVEGSSSNSSNGNNKRKAAAATLPESPSPRKVQGRRTSISSRAAAAASPARRLSSVGVMNIDDDSDSDDSVPNAKSTLNRMKDVLGVTAKKFPAKLDASPKRNASRGQAPSSPAAAAASGMRSAWTEGETQALLDGVARHGFGMWKEILDDNEFHGALIRRTNINLKDRYRTLIKLGLVE